MGKDPKKRQKQYLTFDDKARSDYLTGFQKRRQERKVKAQNDITKKFKNEVRQQRNKRRKEAQEKVNEILQGIKLPDELMIKEEQSETIPIDFGTHEVFVKENIDFGNSGLFVTATNNEEETIKNATSNDQRKPKNSTTNTLQKQPKIPTRKLKRNPFKFKEKGNAKKKKGKNTKARFAPDQSTKWKQNKSFKKKR